jgi:hypothetical protein
MHIAKIRKAPRGGNGCPCLSKRSKSTKISNMPAATTAINTTHIRSDHFIFSPLATPDTHGIGLNAIKL